MGPEDGKTEQPRPSKADRKQVGRTQLTTMSIFAVLCLYSKMFPKHKKPTPLQDRNLELRWDEFLNRSNR